MFNALFRAISKGLAGSKTPLASDVNQFYDLLNAQLDAGTLTLAPSISTLSTGGISAAPASGGILGVGSYFYKFTYVTGNLQADGTAIINGETPGSASISVTTTTNNQKVTISGLPAIGTWPVTAIGIRIYRTAVGGADGTEKLVTTLFTNYLRTTFVTSYLDAIADGSLGAAVPTTNTTGTTFAPLTAHESDYTLQVPYGGVTTGSANVYALAAPTISALTVGMAISVKFNVDSTAASTLNWNGKGAKGIKKSNGTDVTNLKATGIYTLRYDGTNFILQGEGGSGNALASNLLSGKTASTDAGDIVGTMPENGALNYSPSTASQSIPAGHTSGGTVNPVTGTAAVGDVLATKTFSSANGIGITGTMPNHSLAALAGGYISPVSINHDGSGNLVFEPQTGYYTSGLNGSGYGSILYNEANFIAANIPYNKSMFGLVGTGVNAKYYASGNVTSSTTQLSFDLSASGTETDYYVNVSGLNFPNGIAMIKVTSSVYNTVTIYSPNLITSTPNTKIIKTQNETSHSSYRLSGNAIVNNTSFQLPVNVNNVALTWEAWGL